MTAATQRERELDSDVLAVIAHYVRPWDPADLHERFFVDHDRTEVDASLSRLVDRGRIVRDPAGAVTWRPPDKEPRPTGGSWA